MSPLIEIRRRVKPIRFVVGEAVPCAIAFGMPTPDTLCCAPIAKWAGKYYDPDDISIDPFARDNMLATYRNDLNPATAAEWHEDAPAFLKMLIEKGVKAMFFIFDPPYSPRQIKECYDEMGLKPGMKDTQNARLAKTCLDLFQQLAAPGAICLSFGWSCSGMTEKRGFKLIEMLVVRHGGAHNATICLAERFGG
jgi:hypothetical protein